MCARIKKIEVVGLLHAIDFTWELTRGVNILSGGNGSGKSTLLRAIAAKLQGVGQGCSDIIDDIKIECEGEVTDRSVRSNFGVTPVDIAALARVDADKLNVFYDIVDRLFHSTGKTVMRGMASGDVHFNLSMLGYKSVELNQTQLSSGERLILQLFASILVNEQASILILDEPEISLSIEWQKSLLSDILLLNDSLQILVATHSPAIVMNGWLDSIFEISPTAVRRSNKHYST